MLFARKAKDTGGRPTPMHLLAASLEPYKPVARSVIGATLTVDGNLRTDADLLVDGQIKGDVRCAQLIVGKGGIIIGNIVAHEVVVRGTVKGTIRAISVILEGNARVEKEIVYKTLVIERGTYFEGVIRHREDPMKLKDAEIVAAATKRGGDPLSLKYLVRPLLAMQDNNHDDPVAWATELSMATRCHDTDVLMEAANGIVVQGNGCPAIPAILDECERIDREIGGQKTMSAAMYQMYAVGGEAWNPKWGPLPGERGCRLRRDLQDRHWRKLIELTRTTLLDEGWADEPAGVLGLKIMEIFEQNAGVSFDRDNPCGNIARKIRVEFGLPLSATATRAARILLSERERSKAQRHDEAGARSRQETEHLAAAL